MSKRLLILPVFWISGYIIWNVTLLIFSSLPSLPSPGISHFDKVEHAVFFAAGHFCLGLALVLKFRPHRTQRWLVLGFAIVVVAAIVGTLDEWHQSFTPGRSGNDLGDIIADATGGLIAAALLAPAYRFISRRFAAQPSP